MQIPLSLTVYVKTMGDFFRIFLHGQYLWVNLGILSACYISIEIGTDGVCLPNISFAVSQLGSQCLCIIVSAFHSACNHARLGTWSRSRECDASNGTSTEATIMVSVCWQRLHRERDKAGVPTECATITKVDAVGVTTEPCQELEPLVEETLAVLWLSFAFNRRENVVHLE